MTDMTQYKIPEIQVWALRNYNMNNFNKYQLYALRELTITARIYQNNQQYSIFTHYTHTQSQSIFEEKKIPQN